MTQRGLKVFAFMLFMLFLISMEFWIGWNGRKPIMLAIIGVLTLLAKFLEHVPFKYSNRNLILCLMFYGAFYVTNIQYGPRILLTQLPTQFIPIVCVLFLRDDFKKTVLDYITKWFAYLMLIALAIYFILFVVPLPDAGIIEFGEESRYGQYENYIFCVKSLENEGGLLRFSGPFVEPGHLGMMCAFLLMANHFNFFNKWNIVLSISLVASFSLAGFALAIVGYLLSMFNKGRLSIYQISLALLILFLGYNGGKYYNMGDNIINEKVLSRLEYDEDKGFIGNNRNTNAIDLYYLAMLTDSHTLMWGYSEKGLRALRDWEKIGVGYRHFMVFHGLFGLIWVFAFYVFSLFWAKDKRFCTAFLIFVIVSFWQRSYALWFSWIICFHYACVAQDIEKKLRTFNPKQFKDGKDVFIHNTTS